jgi:hypothetical protein
MMGNSGKRPASASRPEGRVCKFSRGGLEPIMAYLKSLNKPHAGSE